MFSKKCCGYDGNGFILNDESLTGNTHTALRWRQIMSHINNPQLSFPANIQKEQKMQWLRYNTLTENVQCSSSFLRHFNNKQTLQIFFN